MKHEEIDLNNRNMPPIFQGKNVDFCDPFLNSYFIINPVDDHKLLYE